MKFFQRIDAALGKIPCDLIVENTTYLDVFSATWRKGSLAIHNGVIVGLEPGLKGKRTIDGRKLWAVPGFIDAHVHVESSLLLPENFERLVLPLGTTTAICDPHELANVIGKEGIKFFLDRSEKMQLDLQVMLSSCVPATHLETNGGGTLTAKDLLSLKDHPKAGGLAEMMNVPGVVFQDPHVHEKLEAFEGSVIDGHCPLLTGRELAAYAACGISSCHETTQLKEAEEKLTNGLSIWIREGSVAKDLERLHPLMTLATSPKVGFCTDDRNPLDIQEEGHLDFLIRKGIQYGIAPEVAYRSASWTVANHYGLKNFGALAPGYFADIVLLEDFKTCKVHSVLKQGRLVSELEWSKFDARQMTNSIKVSSVQAQDFEGPSGRVHIIGVIPHQILTERSIGNSNDKGVAKISVLERYGHASKPSNAYVHGFGDSFHGAIASSVGHDSHNLIVVGDNTQDMAIAIKALTQAGGGYCVVQNQSVLAQLELPFGGLMTAESAFQVRTKLHKLREASSQVGCALKEPFLQLAFLSLPVIPSLKLTDKGLVDVDKFDFVSVRAG